MPKQVDHDARRRHLAEAVFEVIDERGYEAVTLRDVAAQAGVSTGTVQHYFDSRHAMLLFALQHLRARVLARMQGELARLRNPSRRKLIRSGMRMMLPLDEASRQEAKVNVAFFSAATVTPAYADLLREGYQRLLTVTRHQLREAAEAGDLTEGIDTDAEATELFVIVQGLVGPLLMGAVTEEQALAVLDHHLDHLFR